MHDEGGELEKKMIQEMFEKLNKKKLIDMGMGE